MAYHQRAVSTCDGDSAVDSLTNGTWAHFVRLGYHVEMTRPGCLLLLLAVLTTTTPAFAEVDPLALLRARVAADASLGKPLVVEAHVALCDNSIIRCGGHGLGDGDSLSTNLY